MARLIDDLLSLSRIEQRAHQRPETPVDLVSIVRQVADGLQTLAQDREIKVEITAPPDAARRAGRSRRTHAAVREPDRERLEIRRAAASASTSPARPPTRPAARARRWYRCATTVRASRAEHLPRLTERFYRVDVGESRAQGGTGLGLALVKHILNRHQGRLSIDSKEGEGATFTVRLQLSPAAPSPRTKPSLRRLYCDSHRQFVRLTHTESSCYVLVHSRSLRASSGTTSRWRSGECGACRRGS